jgi:uncharacterized protein with von Willebrand factor type A (vWA) domain
MSKIGFNRDWFRRKEEDAYSFYNKNDELFDWEDTHRSGYSSYFVRDTQNLKTAANMVGSMFKVMGVTKKMKLTSKIEMQPASGNPSIHVPLAMLKGEDGEYKNHDTKLLDAFYGAAIQNAALATMQGQGDYRRTANAMSNSTKTTPKDLLFTILNTERVNKKLSERFPGYSKFVQKYKQHKFDENYEPLSPEEHEGKRLLELITKFLRYPANIEEQELKEFEKPITQIEKYVKKHGFPTTSAECEQQASYMYGVVKKYIKEQEEPEEDGSCPNPGPTADDLNDLSEQLMQQMMSGATPEEGDPESDQEFQDFTEDMDEKNSPPKLHNYGTDGNAEDSKIKFIKPEVNKDKYQRELKEIDTCKASVLAQLFARKCKDYQFAMKSMRSGRLDTNKIAEAKQNVPTIYERFGEVKTNKLNIGVLVDESGSMDGHKIKKARQAAIFLYEVFRKVPDARIYVYGHTADGGGGGSYGDTMIRTYVEHGKGINGYTLGDISARHNNRDGHAIYAVAKKIRSMNEDPCLLFVISDGAPYASGYDGQMAIDDTRKKVTQAQALGFQVIQIAIEEHVPCEEMFDYHIKMTDIKNLPNDIIAYVSKRVDKLIKSKTIM